MFRFSAAPSFWLLPTRDNDTMGLAFNYAKYDNSRLITDLQWDETTSVWELFYNIEFTPAIHLTLDAQVVDGTLDTDTALILGTQLRLRL